MKTFDEAFQAVAPRIEVSAPVSHQKAVEAHTEELHAKAACLVEEIRTHPNTQCFIDTLVRLGCEDHPSNALFTAFVNGVLVGIDMERQELPYECGCEKACHPDTSVCWHAGQSCSEANE